MWSLTMVFGYTPLGSGEMLYCNQTPFPLREVGVWARDYEYGSNCGHVLPVPRLLIHLRTH